MTYVASHAACLALLTPSGIIGQSQDRAPAPVRLPAGDVDQRAREARQTIPAQLAEGFELTLWAPTEFVTDPIGLDIDRDGTVYVVGSARSGMPMDIRKHPDWVPEVHTLRTVEDLRQFFRRHLAPERSASNTWLPDRNADGSHDWRDLTTYKERIYRIRDTDGDGRADESLVVFEGFNEDVASDIAGGVLAHQDALYVTAAPDLWRLRDTSGDGVMDEKTSLSHGYSIHPAYGGHDMSGVMAGPDGRLYWKVGDIGLNVVDQTGRRWEYPNQGAILRSNFDGSGFEVFATGLRNAQEFDFDDYGNMISVDNDGDHKGESERVVYITYGSDAGWRSTWQYGKYTDTANNRYNDWMDEGLSPSDAVAIARAFAEAGCDLIDVSAGQTSEQARPVYGRMFQTPLSDRIRNEAGVATMAVGNIYEPDHVNSILAAGRADLCALARPHLADPNWSLRAAAELGWRGQSPPVQYRAGFAQLARNLEKQQQAGPV